MSAEEAAGVCSVQATGAASEGTRFWFVDRREGHSLRQYMCPVGIAPPAE